MKIRLLKDMLVNGKVKVVAKRGREPIAFFKDKIIEASDTTAKKWVDKGIAEYASVAKTAD